MRVRVRMCPCLMGQRSIWVRVRVRVRVRTCTKYALGDPKEVYARSCDWGKG